ncbi:MAG: AbrB/MazE/SpoVT family DNA-binding domain-containing protein [Thiohalomonadales bacterium]
MQNKQKSVINHFPGVEYFDVTEDNGKIVLVPLKVSRAGDVRIKLEQLGIDELHVKDAIDWARKR